MKSQPLLPRFPLPLFKSSLTNRLMHRFVKAYDCLTYRPKEGDNAPGHQSVAPVWDGGVSIGEEPPTSPNMAEGSTDEISWVWDSHAGFSDLRHGGGDEVTLGELNSDPVRF